MDKLKTLILEWEDGTFTIVKKVKYLSYSEIRDEYGYSVQKKFLYVHGAEGTPNEIFRIDDKLRHMKLTEGRFRPPLKPFKVATLVKS